MKKNPIRIISLVLTSTILFVCFFATFENEGVLVTRALARDPGTFYPYAVLSDELLEANQQSAYELSMLYQSFYDQFAEDNKEWDWIERWDNRWELVYPSWYGGTYVNDRQEGVVQVTKLDRSILNYIWEHTGNKDILVKEVKYSWGELGRTQITLRNVLIETRLNRYVAAVGLNPITNSIDIQLLINDRTKAELKEDGVNVEGSIEGFLVNTLNDAFGNSQGTIDLEMISFEQISEETELTTKPGEKAGLTSTLSYDASLGYRARRTVNGSTINGYISTGHAGWARYDSIFARNSSGGSTNIGYLYDSWRSISPRGPDDFSFVAAVNHTPTNNIAYMSYTHLSSIQHVTTGVRIGKSGHSTGWTEGYVYRVNVDFPAYSYQTGVIEIERVTTSPFASSGDSGGIVVSVGSTNTTSKYVVGIVLGSNSIWSYAIPASTPGLRYDIYPY